MTVCPAAALLLILAVVTPYLHAEIEFVGATTDTQGVRIALTDTSTEITRWVKIGDEFSGFRVADYDTKTDTVHLTGKDGVDIRLQQRPAEIQPATTSPKAEEYIVRAGDTGAKIARAADTTLGDLQRLNPGVQWSKLHVGQKVRIK